MTSYFDHDAIAEIIEAGRLRQSSSDQIADDVVQRLQQGGWASAAAHPIRAGILRLLRANGQISPARAAEQLGGLAVGRVSYHFRKLQDLGIVEVCDEIPRRGAVEHVYRLVE